MFLSSGLCEQEDVNLPWPGMKCGLVSGIQPEPDAIISGPFPNRIGAPTGTQTPGVHYVYSGPRVRVRPLLPREGTPEWWCNQSVGYVEGSGASQAGTRFGRTLDFRLSFVNHRGLEGLT